MCFSLLVIILLPNDIFVASYKTDRQTNNAGWFLPIILFIPFSLYNTHTHTIYIYPNERKNRWSKILLLVAFNFLKSAQYKVEQHIIILFWILEQEYVEIATQYLSCFGTELYLFGQMVGDGWLNNFFLNY